MISTTTTNNVQQIQNTDPMIEKHLKAVEDATAYRLKELDTKIGTIQKENQEMAQTANTLVKSLQQALAEMNKSQSQHEQVIVKNDATVKDLIQHSKILWDRNQSLEMNQKKQQEVIEQNIRQSQMIGQQNQALWSGQEASRGKLNTNDELIQQMQRDLAQMREDNRNRPNPPIAEKKELQPSQAQLQNEDKSARDKESLPPTTQHTVSGPGKTSQDLWERYHPPYYTNPPYASYPDWSGFQYEQMPGNHTAAGSHLHPGDPKPVGDPGKITLDSRGFDPLPSHGYPNMMIDSCPGFTPNTFQNWKREVKLWIAGMPGATVTQILAKLIHALPLSVKTDALLYMEPTEKNPETRSVDHIMRLMDQRYGRTDSERACSWLTAFAEFKRETNENYKDFWARFNRCTAKLAALDMPMTQQVIFNRSIQALRLPE